jgi:hypothetical protein
MVVAVALFGSSSALQAETQEMTPFDAGKQIHDDVDLFSGELSLRYVDLELPVTGGGSFGLART